QHDCLAVYMSPGIALCLGIVAQEFLGRRTLGQPMGRYRAIGLGVSLVCLTTWFAFRSISYPIHIQTAADRAYGYTSRELGNVVRAHTDRGEGAIVACEETCAP